MRLSTPRRARIAWPPGKAASAGACGVVAPARSAVAAHTPAFRALNPNAMVPVLVEPSEPARGGEADFVLWESNTICRYLTAREGRHDLLGPTLHERARVEQWMDWQAGELNNSWRYVFMARVRLSLAHTDTAALQAGLDALKPGGVLAAVLYSGKVIGNAEKKAAAEFFRSLPLADYTVLICEFANWADTAPLPCFVIKREK